MQSWLDYLDIILLLATIAPSPLSQDTGATHLAAIVTPQLQRISAAFRTHPCDCILNIRGSNMIKYACTERAFVYYFIIMLVRTKRNQYEK